MKYLLDTNAWIYIYSAPDKLSSSCKNALANEYTFALATISLLEVCRKEAVGKLQFHTSIRNWLNIALPKDQVTLLSITPEIAIEANQLGEDFHKDPADRLITATARMHKLTLVTSDERLIEYPGVKTLSVR